MCRSRRNPLLEPPHVFEFMSNSMHYASEWLGQSVGSNADTNRLVGPEIGCSIGGACRIQTYAHQVPVVTDIEEIDDHTEDRILVSRSNQLVDHCRQGLILADHSINGQTVGILEFSNALNRIWPKKTVESGTYQSLNCQHRAPISKASSIKWEGGRLLQCS